MTLNPIRLYILPGFPSPTNSHGFWAALPPQPPVAGEEDDEVAVLLAGPFAPMVLRLKRAKEMRGGHLGSKEPNQPTQIQQQQEGMEGMGRR